MPSADAKTTLELYQEKFPVETGRETAKLKVSTDGETWHVTRPLPKPQTALPPPLCAPGTGALADRIGFCVTAALRHRGRRPRRDLPPPRRPQGGASARGAGTAPTRTLQALTDFSLVRLPACYTAGSVCLDM